jgi:23S rRNA U2552 (ribose-2'-O)-methylase RlmE/FtsJ
MDYITHQDREEKPQDKTELSQSLSSYLYEIKERIHECEYEWDNYKKYTNPYEFIHTNIPDKKRCVAKYKPLSRSFFKMIELASFFKLYNQTAPTIKTFHLAEGPGGFIEAIAFLRKGYYQDTYIGMTLLTDETDTNIPGWKKSYSFLRENPQVKIETGSDQTGNLLSFENLKYCAEKYGSSMDFITGDGGFDFSVNFNDQEIDIGNLLFAQVAFALVMQKHKGSFILKIFDSFIVHTIDILAILASFYDKVYVTKPDTSRCANSEKYIVCRGFIHESVSDFLPFLYHAFEKMTLKQSNIKKRFLNTEIPHYFISKMEEYNAIIGQQQIENIHYTLTLIQNKYKNDKIDAILKANIQKCVQWCIKHNISYHTNIQNNSNIFLFSECDSMVR